jgi:hypothetical protein
VGAAASARQMLEPANVVLFCDTGVRHGSGARHTTSADALGALITGEGEKKPRLVISAWRGSGG